MYVSVCVCAHGSRRPRAAQQKLSVVLVACGALREGRRRRLRATLLPFEFMNVRASPQEKNANVKYTYKTHLASAFLKEETKAVCAQRESGCAHKIRH
jgi:gluconate kinase